MKTYYRGYYIIPYITPTGQRFGFDILTAGLKRAGLWSVNLKYAKQAIDDWWLNGGRMAYVKKYFAGVKLRRSTTN